MIEKKFRLKGDDFKRFFNLNFKKIEDENFKVFYLKNSLNYSRFSVKPSLKLFKKPTERNKIKRRIYNIIRNNLDLFKDKFFDIIIFPQKKDFLFENYKILEEKILKILTKIK